jgi:hypothetical protein
MNRYTLAQLKAMPTITQGHVDDLKIHDDRSFKVWLSRLTREDGQTCDNEVTVERYVNGAWMVTESYEAV